MATGGRQKAKKRATSPTRDKLVRKRKPGEPKSGNPKSVITGLRTQLRESLEQQTATAQVLQVINASHGNLEPIFDIILEKAIGLCGAKFGVLFLHDGKVFTVEAARNVPSAYEETVRGQAFAPGTNPVLRHLQEHKAPFQAKDVFDEAYAARDPLRVAAIELAGVRSLVAVPLLKGAELIGFVGIYRDKPGGFADSQIALVSAFADQAVIAIENARLLSEQREALEQQTATAEVLQVINSSPGDLAPVFDVMLEKAMTLCGAAFGFLTSYDGQRFTPVAMRGVPPSLAKYFGQGMDQPSPGEAHFRILQGEDVIHNPDQKDDEAYRSGLPLRRAVVDLGGARTALVVALRKDGAVLGALTIYRKQVQPFSDKQVALMRNFAAQAVIAMENARLLGELRQRTDGLTESLEYQTATSELLEVISRSASNVQPVMDTILAAAARLCGTSSGAIAIRRDNAVRIMAVMGVSTEVEVALRKRNHTDQRTLTGRTVNAGQVVHVDDLAADADYSMPEIVRIAHMRTALGVPLLRDGESVGAIVLSRDHVEPFSERQIALIRTFADQAVIAMENARLLGELRQRTDDLTESLEYQTATSELLEVISRSTSNVQPVLDTMLAAAGRLCDTTNGGVALRQGDVFRYVAGMGLNTQFADMIRREVYGIDRATTIGRVALSKGVVQIDDARADPDYHSATTDASNVRTLLGVPLLREGEVIGVIVLTRARVEAFTERQIGLMRTFADQAVIAMENARLLSELTRREQELSVTFEHMGDGVVMFDAGLKIGAWNRNFQELLDIPDSFLAQRPGLDDYVRLLVGRGEVGSGNVGEEVARYHERADQAWSTERTRPDGRVIEVRNNPIPGGGAVLIYSDITERKRAEAEIAAARDAAEAALERQTATADILKVIASSPSDTQPAFDAVAQNANRLLGGSSTAVWRFEGGKAWLQSFTPVNPESDEALKALSPIAIAEHETFVPIIQGRIAQVPDTEEGPESIRQVAQLRGNRSQLFVPLMARGTAIGYIGAARRQAGTFASEDIQLLQTFADQAVIAIQNARLFTDLGEALEQQTATAEILRVISQSPTDVNPVLAAVVKAALKFCGARDALVSLRDGDKWFIAAHEGPIGATSGARQLTRGTAPGRAMVDGKVVHIADLRSPEADEYPEAREFGAREGFRAVLAAPLLRDDVPIGAISLRRPEAGPFTPSQVDLLKSFAAQAVIAIENVRLFTELKESLEQQTATSEILRVISQSPDDVQPVLDAVAVAAVRFCGAEDAAITLREGNEAVIVAHTGPLSVNRRRLLVDKTYVRGRVILEGRTIHVPDLLATDDYPAGRQQAQEFGHRAVASAPLLREGEAIGCLTLQKPEPTPFTDRQIQLLEAFAAQAVIAIENVRLFTELSDALEQQTATADILSVISRSPTDVQPVLEAVTRAALRFCGAPDALVLLRDGDENVVAAHQGMLGATLGLRRPITANFSGQALLEGRTLQIADVDDLDPAVYAGVKALASQHKWRASAAAPMMHAGKAIGCVVLRKPEPGLLSARQIELLETFAAQAVIAIENVRLFTELRDSLERLKAAQANLIQAEKMASLGQLTAGIAHEIKNPLNFVNNFSGLSVELLDELKEAAAPVLAGMNEGARAEFGETVELLTSNLHKIAEHGKRADGIVKSMLSHSRGGTGDWQESNINALVEEALNLAYHGARAQDGDFNVTLERDFAPETKAFEVVPQDVTRVFLNLFGNGFYATRKRHLGGADAGYRPTLRVSTRDLGEAVEIRVRDNGTGIQPEVRAKLFQPFFTTKPTGEGTGLGLSISYDIVTQQHGGTIEVESEPGSFTEFTVRLPRRQRAA